MGVAFLIIGISALIWGVQSTPAVASQPTSTLIVINPTSTPTPILPEGTSAQTDKIIFSDRYVVNGQYVYIREGDPWYLIKNGNEIGVESTLWYKDVNGVAHEQNTLIYINLHTREIGPWTLQLQTPK
jgi:hypothetical protein